MQRMQYATEQWTRMSTIIDRDNWGYDEDLIKGVDAHLLRPYSEHKEEIDYLIGVVLESSVVLESNDGDISLII